MVGLYINHALTIADTSAPVRVTVSTESSVTFSWNAVHNSSSYVVSNHVIGYPK